MLKHLHPLEREALFSAIENDDSRYHVRNKAMIYLAEYAALRISEVGMIRMSDINLDFNEIYFRRLKKSNNNTLRILDARVYDALVDYLSYREAAGITSEYLFVSQKGTPISRKTLHEIIKRYCQIANIPSEKSHFHVLKHTCIVDLANWGLDIKELQYWAGHRNVANTEIYMQFTSMQQEALYRKIVTRSALTSSSQLPKIPTMNNQQTPWNSSGDPDIFYHAVPGAIAHEEPL